ncbi:hypothetical protein E3T39_07635 [Cryobacterium suzukii]|uniref:DUF4333 domain-containing protein n=1 Tax=Cryobacterium suzukii TaxID=1259198 RepID=A0A4R9AHC8_9MICO|nr:hypothetical protein [Cryobacterium suzukii]TFD60967.1 hypothetical protein E3T39_07635 [Cryobacterium suzukii]
MNLTAPFSSAPTRTFAALGALVLLVVLSGCAGTDSGAAAGSSASATAAAGTESATTDASPADCAGVVVVVDFGLLDADTITQCVDTTETIAAGDALESAGITTEGTVEYGDMVACRVNDRPAADETIEVEGQEPFTESCATMAPMHAYWGLWVQASPEADWEYAPVGLGELEIDPGHSLGLLFTTTGMETATPGS